MAPTPLIVTTVPVPILPDQLTSLYMMSKVWCEANNAAKPVDKRKGVENAASVRANGTGPFRLRSRDPGIRTVLVRNPQYWGKIEGNVTEVVWTPIGNDATRVAALKSGELDLMQPVPVPISRMRTGFAPPATAAHRRRRDGLSSPAARAGACPRRAATGAPALAGPRAAAARAASAAPSSGPPRAARAAMCSARAPAWSPSPTCPSTPSPRMPSTITSSTSSRSCRGRCRSTRPSSTRREAACRRGRRACAGEALDVRCRHATTAAAAGHALDVHAELARDAAHRGSGERLAVTGHGRGLGRAARDALV
jgi:hypothetical protein